MVKNSSPSSVESGVSAPAPWLPIGQRLRNRRVQLGFRKGAVAAHLEVSMMYFEQMEAGQIEISPVLLGRLSELLKVPVLYFFEDMFPKGDDAEPSRAGRGAVSDEERVESLVTAFRKLDRDKQQYLLVLARALEQDTGSVRVITK